MFILKISRKFISNNPAVLEAAVIGITDDKWGDSSKAFVVLREREKFSEEELIAQSNQNLAKYQQIVKLKFISALPQNPSGKILKYELRKGLEENKS